MMMTQIIYLLIAFILTAILGKIIIPILKKLKIGQSERLDGPRAHLKKQGTPTMGGIMMIISIVVVTLAYCFLNRENKEIIPVVAIALASIGFGIVGFIDDFKKVVLRNTEGLNPKLKMLGLLIISVIYTMFLVNYTNLGTDIIIPFINYDFILPIWIYIPFTIFVMLAATNAVNLTDGVDGLAGSVSAIMITAISVIAVKLGYENISIFGAIVVGCCAGFLIYNFYKAKVMMGDTGSLLLGGVISSMTIYLKMPLWLIIIAIIPVIETLSVIFQVLYFRKTGKRLFRMSPLHHHFELTGWRENKVVAVFSLVTFVASTIAILIV
ncbi:MAG TPA: phospho-N-acetylmuramoyl-pentapeptide-transferase [Candidatus Scatovivens faecipullorum]|nr:phospho-N-acetylmuramoyl-pentapeptide-transferase [Candidatus Scatovivens faecipullorum]